MMKTNEPYRSIATLGNRTGNLFVQAALICAMGWSVACTSLSGPQSKFESTAARPNIVFIFADDWGYGDLGIHGSTFCKTPRIDRLAEQGTDFQNFTVSHPVCSPSRTAVMTGQFPARHSVHRHFSNIKSHQESAMPDWLDPQAPLLSRMLKDAGYATGHFGKWHLSSDLIPDAPEPTEYGFDEYGAFKTPGGPDAQMKTASTAPRAADFIRRNQDQPFFVNVWLHEPHTPHYPQEKYLEQFETLEEQQQVYAAVIAEADAGVGLILDTLADCGLDENTLVVFSSDNGPESTGRSRHLNDAARGPGLGTFFSVGETGGLKGRKRSLYAGGVRTPFIAKWPGVIPAGRVDRDSVLTAVDLLPTFADLAGASLPSDYQPDGESVVSALQGEPFDRAQPIFWEWKPAKDSAYTWPHQGVRSGPWKLLLNESLGRAELYDMENDWAQGADLSADHPLIVEQLTEKIHTWKQTLPSAPLESCLSELRKPL